MSLVLEQISHITPSDKEVTEEKYFDPSIIISLLTKEIKELTVFEDFQERLLMSYQGNEREPLEPRNLEIRTSDFAQELMNINSWSEAASKLQGTSVMRIAQEWASTQLLELKQIAISVVNISNQNDKLDAVKRLRDICKAYEFAESGEGKELLITEPIRNLAQSFTTGIPRAISIGAKGAGKTFMYLQIARFKYWENFLEKVLGNNYSSSPSINIYPLLEPKHVQPPAKKIISEARNEVFLKMGTEDSFIYSDCIDRIATNLANSSLNSVDWSKFWIREIANAVCAELDERGEHTLLSINRSLNNRNLKFTFLIDGLEDIFTEVHSNTSHKMALRELLDIPRRLLEIRHISFGIIILVRRDFLRYLFDQNLKQFESQYKNYDLYWNEESFLRLVFWICSQAEIIGAQNENGDQLSCEEIRDRLQKLWGMKLGAPTSKEANTSNWVFAALTDFQGRIQARDIVRILYHASSITVTSAKAVQFDVSRILPPQSIRNSLKPCSESKVAETTQEYPQFKTWLESIESIPSANRTVPFDLNDAVAMGIDQPSIKMLEDIGAIYGDIQKDGTTKYYMPEIFRAGLGFTLLKGARPRVLVLQRKALSKR
jgi:CxxC motif-containing protein